MKRIALLLAFALVARAEEPVTPPPGTTDAFRQFANILDVLQQHYIDPEELYVPERSSLAFRQFVRSLDSEADLLAPVEYTAAKAPADGDVGLAVAARGGAIVVISARDGSPAHHAGLYTGDEIITNARLSEVRAALRGPVGEPVRLQVRGQREVTLVRVAITNVPPSALKFLQNGVAYCRLADISEPARERLELDLTRAVRERVRGLILDVRNNAGGSLDALLHIARLFVPDKAEIVSLDFAGREQRVVFTGDASPKFTAPAVLLVNGGTAAEAEIFAAALRDNGRARLVGSRTFGRGWNYGLFALPDGFALQIPTARYVPPSKQSFQGAGLVPDVAVEVPRDVERSLARAGFGSFGWANDRAQVLKTDRALARALELLAP